MKKWDTLADDQTIKQTLAALKENGIEAEVSENSQNAKKRVLELLPKGVETMDMSSITLGDISIAKEINASDNYISVRSKLMTMDKETQGQEMQKLGAAPVWAIGSVHAVTEDGKVLIASNTGSQLPAYAYGSNHVIWVVGTQKIVKDISEGMRRIYEYTLPLESERAKKAYGVPGSAVNKILIINKEVNPGRIKLIFVKEKLGF